MCVPQARLMLGNARDKAEFRAAVEYAMLLPAEHQVCEVLGAALLWYAKGIAQALKTHVESREPHFAGTSTTCLCTKTSTPTAKNVVVSTRGDSVVPNVNMVIKYLRAIDGAVPKYGRAPKTALERFSPCALTICCASR